MEEELMKLSYDKLQEILIENISNSKYDLKLISLDNRSRLKKEEKREILQEIEQVIRTSIESLEQLEN